MDKLRFCLKILLDALFPAICMGCQCILSEEAVPALLCSQCRNASSTAVSAFTCPVCRGRIPIISDSLPPRSSWCHPRAAYLVLACSRYDAKVIQELIQLCKFKRNETAGYELGLIATRAYVSSNCIGEATVVPIPLSSNRSRDRGFNQSEIIARTLCAAIPSLTYCDALIKIRDTKAQTTLHGGRERYANVAGCFAWNKNALVKASTVILIDDVWTTGSTMNEAANVIASQHSGHIIALVIARAH